LIKTATKLSTYLHKKWFFKDVELEQKKKPSPSKG
jgi:hypothetical protein